MMRQSGAISLALPRRTAWRLTAGHFLATVTASVLMTLGFWVSTPLNAAAADACSGPRTNLFDGKFSFTTTTYGSSARISTEYPALCTGGAVPSFSNAWSMLASNSTDGWMQSGYIREGDFSPNVVYFAQWRKNSATAPNTLFTSPGPASEDLVMYKSLIRADGKGEMYRNTTTLMAVTPWKPADYWGSQPWSNQFSGETGHCATDVPGFEWDKANFIDVKRRTSVGGSWVNASAISAFHDCGSRYQVLTTSTPTSIGFDIWTYDP